MRKSGAFTLIELLVVIAIIAILAAILFPVFTRARQMANKATCLTRMSETGKAFLMYASDNDERAHTLYYRGPDVGNNLGFWRWPLITLPYAKSYTVYLCPSDSKDDPACDVYGGPCRDPHNMYFRYFFGLYPSWGYNFWYLAPPIDPDAPDSDPYIPQALKSMRHPADTVVYAESTQLGAHHPGGSGPGTDMGFFEVKPPQFWLGAPPLNGDSYGHVWPRHDPTHVSVLFLDGHEKSVTLSALSNEDLWQLR